MTGVGGDKCDRCGHGYYGEDITSCTGSEALCDCCGHLSSDWLWSLSSQHAPVLTLEGTVTLGLVSVAAPPTQRDPPVTGVRLDTGVTTPPLAVR